MVLIEVIIFVLVLVLLSGIRVIYEYERGVVFTLGKFSSTKGPGLRFLVPIFQTMTKVDMRVITADAPRQEVITKDNIPVLANSVVYFKVVKPEDAIIKIEDYSYAVKQLTQAAMRDIIGNRELDFVLGEREKIAQDIRLIVDKETDKWGINIEAIKLQEMELPAEMKRAFAKQAEAERARRAAIILSEGELSASQNLKKAAENLSKGKGALHLRTLQTIREIASDPSEKINWIIPTEILELFKKTK
ncbi:SPFH domain-containing protein [Candidatus Woesearchaeota archaeon]|nr:SPFH domain-containing protein [Candidatus Woesearchaeota archaeon]